MTAISSRIGASQMLALEASGYLWFKQITDIWKKRTKQDPVDVALGMHLADMRRRTWDRICWFAGGLCVVLLVLDMVITFNIYERDEKPDLLFALLLLGPLVGMVATFLFQSQYVWKRMPHGRALYDDSGWGIQDRLTVFFSWVHRIPDQYNHCSIDDLRADAGEALVRFATDVVLLEHIPREEREKEWGKIYDEARNKMSSAHQQLKDIGLANDKYDEYYREAERRCRP